jgi:hypothetical protein
MKERSYLGEFELPVLLALVRLGDRVYGIPIAREIEKYRGRDASLAASTPPSNASKRKTSSRRRSATPPNAAAGPSVIFRLQTKGCGNCARLAGF